MVGSTLAHYRITAALGAGGMGEVWRAEDTRLGREVALKLLPEGFADDPERLARFEREAKVLASLNHPNIAHLYGLETAAPRPTSASADSEAGAEAEAGAAAPGREGDPASSIQHPASGGGAVHFLVMELVEGSGLDELIARGPLPVDEAIPIALQIAEALETAHEAGIVHRDLKPANVRVRPDGAVKVLDFGLAKAWDTFDDDTNLSLSPTVTRANTAAGVILGTAAYMSPEQARGKPVDRRSDIWSFGVVLWEMLTGQKLFQGETVSDVLASVLKEAPPIDALPVQTPPHLRRLVRRCLDKDSSTRLRDIGEARIALAGEWPDQASETAFEVAPAAGPRSSRLAWVATAVAAVAAAVLGVLALGRPAPVERVIRFEVPPPPDGRFHLAPDNPGPVAVSPDGTMLAFTARTADGELLLWIRALDEPAARSLPGTERAQYPFWSPDSRRIAFFGQNKLRVVDASGGPPLSLCDAPDGKGGSWSPEGVIVFAPSYNSPLHRVPEAGGESVPVTELDAERNDNSHRHPRFLPDGNHFLYMARSSSGPAEGHAVVIGALDGSVNRMLFRAPAAVEYASGRLLFARDRTLMARPFDADRLEFTGDAFPVAGEVALLPPGTVIGVYSASQNGVLAYMAGDSRGSGFRLVWRDRQGTELGTVGDPASYDEVQLVPGGELAAVAREEGGEGDIWVVDLQRDLFTKFTFERGYESGIVPTPDGRALFFSAERIGSFALMRKEIGGSGEGEILLESKTEVYASSVSSDATFLFLYLGGDNTNYDIWVLPLSGEGDAYPFIETDFDETMPMISPDGRWLVYVSNESGRPEVYVTAFPDRGRKWQISTEGGMAPRWNSEGAEVLYHATDGTLMSVRVESRQGGLLIGEASSLFNSMVQPVGAHFWAPSADGQSLLVMEPVSGQESPNLSVVVNWRQTTDGP